jgi:hypothetical protein
VSKKDVSADSEIADELNDSFSTEAACRDYLTRLKWGRNYAEFRCPKCLGSEYRQTLTFAGLFRCRRCDFQVSVRSGTIFQNSKLALRTWFQAMWHICHHGFGMNACDLGRVVGLRNYSVVWHLLHNLRYAMASCNSGYLETSDVELATGSIKILGGEAQVVCIIEKTKPYKACKMILKRSDANFSELLPTIKDHVNYPTIIWTIPSVRKFLYGEEMRLRLPERKRNGPTARLKLVSTTIGKLKKELSACYHGHIQSMYLQHYLDEYAFWQNNKFKRLGESKMLAPTAPRDLFELLVNLAVRTESMTRQSMRDISKAYSEDPRPNDC